jgi:hypothetical protein
MNNIINKLVEVLLPDDDAFLKIKETLSRIGVAVPKQKKLYQSCHILHKKGKYYIVSFKEMFLIDGKSSSITEEDIARRNTIVSLLEDWGLLRVVDPAKSALPRASLSNIKILSYSEKHDWELIAKYNVGKKRSY